MRVSTLFSWAFRVGALFFLPSVYADTVLQYTSSPDNYVSKIPGHTLTPNSKTRFQINSEDRGNTVYVEIIAPATPSDGAATLLYTLKFSAPTGTALALGAYNCPGVFATAQTPGFDFFGSQGISDPSTGQFTITELTYDASGIVASFAASFSKQDKNNADSCYGTIDYNSGQPQPPAVLPTVSVLTTSSVTAIGGAPGVFTIQRTGATTAAMTVSYTLGGTAVNGVDYRRLIGTAVIAPGQSVARVKVHPLNNGVVGNARVDLTLPTLPGSPYTVAGSGHARLKILR